ncbi:Proteasome activator complex subunit 4 [Leucoagaricus sp. SymC.cos]|nr:Proteasome activator complex subunit 4 [Leucoagaricus sp. SymC.cos]
MALPDIGRLHLNDVPASSQHLDTTFQQDLAESNGINKEVEKLKDLARLLPYSIEPESQMQQTLDLIIMRICQAIEAQDYDVGFLQWDTMLSFWLTLKYPIPKQKRIKLAKLYFELSIVPGMPMQVVANCADAFRSLTRSKKLLTVEDMRLPWKPIYDILSQDLFLTRRQFEYTQLSWCMGYIADNARRFFHPAAINDMLSTFVPLIDGTNLDSVLSSHYYLMTFLPLSHPQTYLPMLLRVWESMNSYKYDERMLHLVSRLSEMHVVPEVSDPKKIAQIQDDAISEGETRPNWSKNNSQKDESYWPGLYKDVGIFTEHEWNLLMCKCLASMEISLADGGSLTTGPSADNSASFEIGRLPKPQWRIVSLARIIVYSMAPDGVPVPASNAPTPMFSPLPSGMCTPQPNGNHTSLGDYLASPLHKRAYVPQRTYLAGSKALDSFARLIASTESFFHPSNSGTWTEDLSAFLKCIASEFNKRWFEEQKPDCKTPMNRRLTRQMKRELVKSMRTVVLLAMFSQDSSVVNNIQGCLKSMCIMEPDLILDPILERAVPSLEALTETHRTIAVIKALGAIAPAIVSREVHYGGAKHLVPILQLLIPGIDLNDPSKTLCTTSFLVEISQYITIGDLTGFGENAPQSDIEPTLPPETHLTLPSLSFDEADGFADLTLRLTIEEEDALLKDSTGSFPDWVASFIRRVIQLLENLPEEGPNGSSGGATEVQVVDAVTGACSQICVHLSEPLFDMVLNMVYDYASTNVRTNAVRAIHQLVECVANANPVKTLAKLFPFCAANIRVELENGASSLRTTSASRPMPSDATLHWNLAILRGAVYNDGRAILKYKDEFIPLLRFLRDKTFSKRGYSWTGKLVSSLLLTLTHTYPLENKFVNPAEWNSSGFRENHHRYWGKCYSPGEVEISWHVPSKDEIQFALQIFRELVEPTLVLLEGLMRPDVRRDAKWRNDFCRYLTFVRNAFAGIPTLYKEHTPKNYFADLVNTTDILDQITNTRFRDEIPEMIANIDPIASGFCLTDPSSIDYVFITTLRQRFGQFLHTASVSLRQQGEENTVDAVQILVRSMRTYFVEYADSRDSTQVNGDSYTSEKNIARLYIGQKTWPRAVYVRRARLYYASTRLRWNSIERCRGPLEDNLIDDLVEWSIWHYPIIRQSGQSVLESISNLYDGVRRRALPILFKALEPGADDDRMKGALWTINYPVFGKYALSEPSLAKTTVEHLFGCQHNEKPSLQNCSQVVFENCLNSFSEPCHLVFNVAKPRVAEAIVQLRSFLIETEEERQVVRRCQEQRIERTRKTDQVIEEIVNYILDLSQSGKLHWRYSIYAVRCLRALVRRDVPLQEAQMRFFLKKVYDNHPTIISPKRYYAQRAIMKSIRFIKLRTCCKDSEDLALMRNHNPLTRLDPVKPCRQTTPDFLNAYKVPVDISIVSQEPIFYDKDPPGWLTWSKSVKLYMPPDLTKSTFQPWDLPSHGAISAVIEVTTHQKFWENVSAYYSEENHESAMIQDNVSCVKSIFQLLEDKPFTAFKPVVEKLIPDKDQNKQRAAAELLAGVLGGSKHWPTKKQEKLWAWFTPHMRKIFSQNIKTDTLPIWSSFVEYMFYHRDPRRIQPLVDCIVSAFRSLDYNAEMAFDAVKVATLFRAFYEELGRKFVAWTDETVERSWAEISSDHDDVRAYIGDILVFSENIKWQPKPSYPEPEAFVRECQIVPADYDILGMRGTYHRTRVLQLVDRFKAWRIERTPGVRAFQSTYDRVGTTVCKWLYQSLHDLHAISAFDYILPLMSEIFRFTELNDNDDLASRASRLLVRMCGVTPPVPLVSPLLDAIFHTIQNSPSWKVRLKALPLVQVVFYFRQLPLIPEIKIVEMLEVLCRCLDDEIVEVREMAAVTLSGILRLSPRRSVLTLKDRFIRLLKNSHIPGRNDPSYNKAIRQRHAAILGICALVESYPYTVEKWLPELLTGVLAEHTYDPIPISTTVRKCASNFKRTHQDTWHEDSKRFNEDQLAALSTLLSGSSYCA